MNSSVHSVDPNIVLSETDAIRRNDDGSFMIDIRRGESSQSVGLRLEKAGLIKSRYFWDIICRLDSEFIKTGTYRLELPASPVNIHRLLVSGREVLYRVTIPEGVTLRKMAGYIEEAGICSAEDFLSAARNPEIINQYGIPCESMEGYLFPDTYFFPAGFPAERVVRTMADNLYNKLETIYPLIHTMNPREINDKIILASIVEREYRVSDEASVMAGVFNNRLGINMALQSCATVEYIITEIQEKPHPNVIYFSDLEIVNPYNTYMYRGLPPGPISAPGIVALTAAMYPQKTEYLYFRLTDPASGRHYFSTSYDDHISAGQLITKSQS
ncbi:MAG: endolytic transglycosylase MltG [Treponema sp.]|nr:endolytic transglycosylase MltG [Treponema sp.]